MDDIRNTDSKDVNATRDIKLPRVNVLVEPLSEQYVLNLFYLRHQRLFHLDKKDTILIYICGHASTQFFKVCDKYYMFLNDIMGGIEYLSSRVKHALVILDTCEAASLIDHSEVPENVSLVTTSGLKEYSYSTNHSRHLGVSSIDDFALEVYKEGINLDATISEYFQEITKRLLSTIQCWGNKNLVWNDVLFGKSEEKVSKFLL